MFDLVIEAFKVEYFILGIIIGIGGSVLISFLVFFLFLGGWRRPYS